LYVGESISNKYTDGFIDGKSAQKKKLPSSLQQYFSREVFHTTDGIPYAISSVFLIFHQCICQ